MSAEGKKKRGESGVANAKSKPYRLNGRAPDWAARSAGVFQVPGSPSCGSTTMRGLVGGLLAAKFGYPMVGDYERMLVHAQARCSHPIFVDDDRPLREAAE